MDVLLLKPYTPCLAIKEYTTLDLFSIIFFYSYESKFLLFFKRSVVVIKVFRFTYSFW